MLPVLKPTDGRVLRERLVLTPYPEDLLPGPPVARPDPYERAVDPLLVRMADELVTRCHTLVMNQVRPSASRCGRLCSTATGRSAPSSTSILLEAPGSPILLLRAALEAAPMPPRDEHGSTPTASDETLGFVPGDPGVHANG